MIFSLFCLLCSAQNPNEHIEKLIKGYEDFYVINTNTRELSYDWDIAKNEWHHLERELVYKMPNYKTTKIYVVSNVEYNLIVKKDEISITVKNLVMERYILNSSSITKTKDSIIKKYNVTFNTPNQLRYKSKGYLWVYSSKDKPELEEALFIHDKYNTLVFLIDY